MYDLRVTFALRLCTGLMVIVGSLLAGWSAWDAVLRSDWKIDLLSF